MHYALCIMHHAIRHIHYACMHVYIYANIVPMHKWKIIIIQGYSQKKERYAKLITWSVAVLYIMYYALCIMHYTLCTIQFHYAGINALQILVHLSNKKLCTTNHKVNLFCYTCIMNYVSCIMCYAISIMHAWLYFVSWN